MEKSYLQFVEIENRPGLKTKVFEVRNISGLGLGRVGFYSPWRRYVFSSYLSTNLYDPECLKQIASFCSEQTLAQKERRKAVASW